MNESCDHLLIPSMSEFWQSPSSTRFIFERRSSSAVQVCVGVATGGLFLTLALFLRQVSNVFSFVSCYRRAHSLIVITAIFPLAIFGSLVGVAIPKAMPVVDAVLVMYYSIYLFNFLDLVISAFGGRREMARILHKDRVCLRTPPICCLLPCLPDVCPSVRNIRMLEFLVYQNGVVRAGMVLFSNVLWLEELGVKQRRLNFDIYLAPLGILSTMSAMWGLLIFNRLISCWLQSYRMSVLFRVAQLVLLLFNLQKNVFGFLTLIPGLIPCQDDDLLPPAAKAHMWHHLLLTAEMGILSLVVCVVLRPSQNLLFDLHSARAQDDSSTGPTSPLTAKSRDDNPPSTA